MRRSSGRTTPLPGGPALVPENTVSADAGEFARRWNEAPLELREARMRKIQDDTIRSTSCFEQEHQARLSHFSALQNAVLSVANDVNTSSETSAALRSVLRNHCFGGNA
jgi:hypothetical protein